MATVATGRGFASSKACCTFIASAVISRWWKPCARMFSSARRVHSTASGSTNFGTNVTIATPPLPGSSSSTSSGTLRGWSHTARADECEKITGATEVASAARIVVAATWDRSTSMPTRFISRTTSWPNGESPPTPGSSVAESAHAMLSLCVRVMYRTPSVCSARSVARELLIECPPSAPINDAIRPAPRAASISSAVVARARSPG